VGKRKSTPKSVFFGKLSEMANLTVKTLAYWRRRRQLEDAGLLAPAPTARRRWPTGAGADSSKTLAYWRRRRQLEARALCHLIVRE
jgi:hypothetical protein